MLVKNKQTMLSSNRIFAMAPATLNVTTMVMASTRAEESIICLHAIKPGPGH